MWPITHLHTPLAILHTFFSSSLILTSSLASSSLFLPSLLLLVSSSSSYLSTPPHHPPYHVSYEIVGWIHSAIGQLAGTRQTLHTLYKLHNNCRTWTGHGGVSCKFWLQAMAQALAIFFMCAPPRQLMKRWLCNLNATAKYPVSYWIKYVGKRKKLKSKKKTENMGKSKMKKNWRRQRALQEIWGSTKNGCMRIFCCVMKSEFQEYVTGFVWGFNNSQNFFKAQIQ